MNRDKQIDEMRHLADEMGKSISNEYEKRVLADERKLEAVLKENGWRKASEVAREIIDDLESRILLSGEGLYTFPVITHGFIAELKKKYTEGCDGQTD